MSSQDRSDQELPELHISEDEGPRCGKFVGKDGDQLAALREVATTNSP